MGAVFRFGIWGCGLISKFHADAIGQIAGAAVSGAYDVNTSAMERFCQTYGAEGYSDQQSFTASEKIDAICICLPSGLHYDAAMACIRNKKHVVIEKPITLNVRQANAIIAAAEENGVQVCVISQLRYTQAVAEIKKVIEAGKLGRITLANAIMKYYREPAYYAGSSWRGTWAMDGGGALMNQGIHGVDLLQYLMGPVTAVSAVAKTLLHNIQTEDTLTAVVEYGCGAIGTIQATTSVYPGYSRRIEICGTKGSITLCEDTIAVWDVPGVENPVPENLGMKNASFAKPDGMDCMLHARQLEDFVASIWQNTPVWVNATEGKKSVEIICAIYESAKTGKKVYL